MSKNASTVNPKINAAQVGTHLSSFCGIYFGIYALLSSTGDNHEHLATVASGKTIPDFFQ